MSEDIFKLMDYLDDIKTDIKESYYIDISNKISNIYNKLFCICECNINKYCDINKIKVCKYRDRLLECFPLVNNPYQKIILYKNIDYNINNDTEVILGIFNNFIDHQDIENEILSLICIINYTISNVPYNIKEDEYSIYYECYYKYIEYKIYLLREYIKENNEIYQNIVKKYIYNSLSGVNNIIDIWDNIIKNQLKKK